MNPPGTCCILEQLNASWTSTRLKVRPHRSSSWSGNGLRRGHREVVDHPAGDHLYLDWSVAESRRQQLQASAADVLSGRCQADSPRKRFPGHADQRRPSRRGALPLSEARREGRETQTGPAGGGFNRRTLSGSSPTRVPPRSSGAQPFTFHDPNRGPTLHTSRAPTTSLQEAPHTWGLNLPSCPRPSENTPRPPAGGDEPDLQHGHVMVEEHTPAFCTVSATWVKPWHNPIVFRAAGLLG